jgi:hypothetical protein
VLHCSVRSGVRQEVKRDGESWSSASQLWGALRLISEDTVERVVRTCRRFCSCQHMEVPLVVSQGELAAVMLCCLCVTQWACVRVVV